MIPASPRILVVEDEPALSAFLRDLMEEHGFTVETASTGKDGLALALANPPDVVLLDLELPDTTGHEVCRWMREKATLRLMPIIILTVRGDTDNEVKGLRAGADDYLTKPIDITRLLARINTAIHRNIRELDANPLTHLPGNASIIHEMRTLIDGKKPFAALFADLNDFKSFNDHYGFMRGDQALKLAAKCLLEGVETRAGKAGPAFVGHVGGDDFVALVPSETAEAVCRETIVRFDAMVPSLYDEEDRRRGHIFGKTRQGDKVRLPFTGLSLVVIRSSGDDFTHPGEVSSLASELKPQAKAAGKSAFVVNRRRAA